MKLNFGKVVNVKTLSYDYYIAHPGKDSWRIWDMLPEWEFVEKRNTHEIK